MQLKHHYSRDVSLSSETEATKAFEFSAEQIDVMVEGLCDEIQRPKRH